MLIEEILEKDHLEKDDIIKLLKIEDAGHKKQLFDKAYQIKEKYIGKLVSLRGLVEFSNKCRKNCNYCGIRNANNHVFRYSIPKKEVLSAVQFAWKNRFGSVVLQSGEQTGKRFIENIDSLVREIKQQTNNEIGITLSCGEQTFETYGRWFESGAHRYLLRIEASNSDLYHKIHPPDKNHDFEARIKALENLKSCGYQVGTGVMIGLPFQTLDNLADDLLFFRDFDIDMVGMGPFIEHHDTPLYSLSEKLLPQSERFFLSLKMIAILRIMMKDINIAAATALQAIDPFGREKALKAGANIIMPNITPLKYRKAYQLYQNKPCLDESAEMCSDCLTKRVGLMGESIHFGHWGDSPHFANKTSQKSIENQ